MFLKRFTYKRCKIRPEIIVRGCLGRKSPSHPEHIIKNVIYEFVQMMKCVVQSCSIDNETIDVNMRPKFEQRGEAAVSTALLN